MDEQSMLTKMQDKYRRNEDVTKRTPHYQMQLNLRKTRKNLGCLLQIRHGNLELVHLLEFNEVSLLVWLMGKGGLVL